MTQVVGQRMFDSPLRYPGGKGRLSQFVIDLLEMNSLTGGDYVEPYAGGAGIAISLLYLEYANRVHLNDINRSVYAFWRSVVDRPEELCKLICDTKVTMAEWRRQKAIQSDANVDNLALGFSTFFLNRTNRSGILKGGVIGGKKQAGDWKLNARYNKIELIRRIQKIASFGPRIQIYNMDAADFIDGPLRTIPRRSLVYLDPPYYVKGRELYESFYDHGDHEIIAQKVSSLRQRWIVSYDNAEPIKKFYSAFRQQTFGLTYSAHLRYVGTEVMVFSNSLKIPGEIIPWRGIAA